jgi:hypothetical protein
LARHQFALLSLAAIAIFSSFWFLVDVLGTATRTTKAFGISAFETRFNELRKTIQPHTVYGYISDTSANDPSALAEFHLTQYTLAPAIIKPSRTEDLVIVNYHSKQLDARLLMANHLVPFRDFGNGVALGKPDRTTTRKAR